MGRVCGADERLPGHRSVPMYLVWQSVAFASAQAGEHTIKRLSDRLH